MKIIPVGNDYALAQRLRDVKATATTKEEVVNDPVLPVQGPEEENGEPGETANQEEEPKRQESGKKKIRKVKKEAEL